MFEQVCDLIFTIFDPGKLNFSKQNSSFFSKLSSSKRHLEGRNVQQSGQFFEQNVNKS